ncbi:ATP-dependent helicase [bacterium]|nr:ATP-dependent helicase [bacterium]
MTENTITNTIIKPNARQQEAIDILNGQVMLLAGPGTGKTFTVINRIEKMLADDVKPSSILCLTFSDAAASEMRQRLIKKMGVIASSVNIYTYHSFCNDVIKEYPSQFELSADVRLISDTEKIEIMKECIDEASLEFFVPTRADKYFFTKNFISYVEKLKTKRLTKAEYLANIDTNISLMPRYKELESEIYEREQAGKTQNKGRYAELEKIKTNIEKAKELWTLYELYSDKMIKHNLIDFSDMINFVLTAFEEDELFLKEVSNKYQYFLVDEYQDTNDLQNSIIFNLVDGNSSKNIFVVGDDDQIIYGFQGAKSGNVENFLTKYPETKVICLEENNRSTQTILDFSNLVVSQDSNRLENKDYFKKTYGISKKLIAKNPKIIAKDRKIRRFQFGETLQEFNYLVDDIKKLVESDCMAMREDGNKDYSQIAIIAKKRAELQTFAELLKGKNIPFQIDEGKSIFAIRSTILIYFYLKAMANHILASDKLFGLMLSEPFKLDLEDYNKILHEQQLLIKDGKSDFISLMYSLSDWKNPSAVENFLKTFESLNEYSTTNTLRNTIVEIINRTGILEYFYRCDSNRSENIFGIKRIITEAENFQRNDSTKSLNDFVKYLDDCLKNEIDINLEKESSVQNAVQLMTYHGSKGREFEYVYLPNLISSAWEDFRMPGEYKLITDEVLDKDEAQAKKDSELLKLLFVGITRAKHSLTLSFADNNDGRAQHITKYLSEFSNYDFESSQFECNADDMTREFVRSISSEVFQHRQAFENEIKERVNSIILSPSRVNDYLTCPRKFFYLKVLGIDVEEADWDNANFGTAVHAILERSVKFAKEKGEYPDISDVLTDFNNSISGMRFSNIENKERFIKLGEKLILNYYPYFSQTPIERVVDVEFSFYGVSVDDDLITGKIDRIEQNSDGTYNLYDYKTGSPVSEKQIALGGSKEGYYNQLCFYKYAYEKLTGNKVSQVGIIYVEDHARSVYKTLTGEDIDYIESLIRQTYADIKALKFDPINEDNYGACQRCVYKHLCKLDLI